MRSPPEKGKGTLLGCTRTIVAIGYHNLEKHAVCVALLGIPDDRPGMAVTALPDTDRFTTYTLVSPTTGPLNVGFQIYGDSTDYANWIEVYINDAKLTAVTDYVLDSPSGGDLSVLARPITDARITFTVDRTGVVEIIGARRPRRTTIFSNGVGVSADRLNYALNDMMAIMRELWDLRSRLFLAAPGAAGGTVLNPNGFVTIASQAEAEAGTDNIKLMTPLRTAQEIIARLPSQVASQAQAEAGTDNVALMTPLRARQSVAWLDVRSFGAVGNGTNDDATAIQAAITAAGAAGGGTVLLPKGVFKIGTALSFPTQAVVMRGAGRLATQIKASFTTGTIIDVAASYTEIDSLAITGPQNAVVTTGSAIRAHGAQSCKFTNLFIADVFTGIDLDNSTNSLVQFCKIFNLFGTFGIRSVNGGGDYIVFNQVDPLFYGFGSYTYTNGFGAWAGSTAYVAGDVRSSNGYFWSCSQSGTSAAAGGLTPTTFGTQVTDGTAKWHMLSNTTCALITVSSANSNYIAFNDCSGPSSQGIKLTNADGNIVHGNTIGQIIGSGIELGTNATFTDVSHNLVSGCYGAFSFGIGDANGSCAGARIIGNRINGAGWYGIFLATPNANAEISSNVVAGTGQTTGSFGIEVAAAVTKFTINGNVIIPGVMSGAIKVAAGASDNYQIVNNLLQGGTVTDGGTGLNKTVQFADNVNAYGATTISTAGIGYTTGAGGAVTQVTSKATGVTLNKTTGTITMVASLLAATTSVAFTLTNSLIAATDTVIVNIKSGATANSYFVSVDAVAAGSCSISLRNYTAGSLSEAVVLSFVVIKGVAA